MNDRSTDTLTVVSATAEFVPFLQVGGLGPVAAQMAEGIAALGHRVAAFLPAYPRVLESGGGEGAVPILTVRFPYAGETRTQRIWRVRRPGSAVDVFLVGDPRAFNRPGIYTDPATGDAWPDDADRWAAFSRGVVEALLRMDLRPDVLHAHDYQTALAPVYLRRSAAGRAFFARTASVLTLHNAAFQGLTEPEFLDRSGLGREDFHAGGPFEFWGRVNLLKAGVLHADELTTVSPRYAEEITTSPEFGYGLEGVLASRRGKLSGFLNGIDTGTWDPSADRHLARPFHVNDLSGRPACRGDLLARLGLAAPEGRAVIGMVSRLTEQKGLDVVRAAASRLLDRDVALVVLGSGRPSFEAFLRELAARHPDRVAYVASFDDPLAHRIYAGADLFLMPSRYEPCGLAQMIAMRYGALPVARRTGGLADTIVSLDEDPHGGTGFLFDACEPEALLDALDRAIALRADHGAWCDAVRRAMALDFSWELPIRVLEAVFHRAAGARRAAA